MNDHQSTQPMDLADVFVRIVIIILKKSSRDALAVTLMCVILLVQIRINKIQR